MHPDSLDAAGQSSAMERFGRDARLDARMLKEGQSISGAQRKALVKDLLAYRESRLIDGKPLSWAKIGERVGVTASVMSEWAKGTYKGDDERVCRLVDQFLVREDQQASGPNIRAFAKIRVITEVLLATVTQAVKRRSIGVVTGESGSCKSVFAKWFCERNDGAVLITCDDSDRDAKFVIDALHAALKLGTYARHVRQKKREIEGHLQTHKNTIIIVDECQKLTPDALEILRSLHDKSDSESVRNVPIILFGDETFEKTVVRSRGGERTPISPQITSRMFPVISLEQHGLQHDDDGQAIPDSVYTKEDVEAIVHQQRLHLVRADAIAWVAKLANIHGHGRLRLAVRVLEIALDIKRGPQVTIDDLRASLDLFLGPRESRICVEAMERQESTAVAKVG